MSNIVDRLRDAVERGDSWQPHATEEHPNPLVGEAIGWDTGKSKDGETECEILTVREASIDKAWAVWCWHTYLRIQLIGDKAGEHPVEERPVQPGDMVAIRWVGKGERQDGGGEVHRYRTAIERPDPAAEAPDTDVAGDEAEGDDIPF